MNILIAEDERDILELLAVNLLQEGYKIYQSTNGNEAWEIFNNKTIDLCIFDVMMPNMDGFQLVKKIREKSEIPIIFLTARGEEMDRVYGLALGADDYLIKPFSMAELKARVQIQLRHLIKMNLGISNTDIEEFKNNQVLVCGGLSLHVSEAMCYCEGKPIVLGAKEFLLLKFFMENNGRVFTKKQLYSAVWQESYLYDSNTIMVHLSRLRAKIEKNPKKPEYVITIRGIGYKFTSSQSLSVPKEDKNERG